MRDAVPVGRGLLRGRRLADARAQRPTPAAASALTFTDVTAAGGHPLPAQQRRLRQEVPARDDGLGRARSSTSTATAGRTSCSSTRWRWPGRPRRDVVAGALPQQPERHVHRRHARRRAWPSRSTASAWRPPTTTTTADVDIYVTGLGPNRLFRNVGGGRFADVTDAGGRRRSRVFDERRCGSTTTATASSTCSSPTTSSGRIDKDLFCTLDGKTKSYCTPESYKGQSSTLYRNHGDGTFEDVDAQGRPLRSRGEGARRRADRLRQRRLARTCSSPTTRSRTGCIATSGTARSPTSG